MASRGQQRLPQPGTLAPGFSLELLTGGALSLGEILSGGPALLVFFKISCPVCQMTFPYLERIHAGGGLRIYAVSQNDAADTQEFHQEFGVTLPTLLDPEDGDFPASNSYGISSVPTMFVVAADGTISNSIEGWRKKEMELLAAVPGGSLFRPGENVPEWKAG